MSKPRKFSDGRTVGRAEVGKKGTTTADVLARVELEKKAAEIQDYNEKAHLESALDYREFRRRRKAIKS